MEFVQISVIKKDRDVRGKPMKIIPQFCPFCGQEYKGKPDAKLSDPAAG